MARMDFFKQNFKMVFAHPDDEILWASSILKYSSKTIICFSDSPGEDHISKGRVKAFSNFPISNVINLNITEINTNKHVNWRNPNVSKYGIHHKKTTNDYKKKYNELYQSLKVNLERNDVLVTHNPWGEYGHEEHTLVFKVLNELKKELSLEIYVTGYVSNRSIYAMKELHNYLQLDPIVCKTDENCISLISNHYKKYKIWTWWDDYEWPQYETFFRLHKSEYKQNQHISSEIMNHIYLNEVNISSRDILKFGYWKLKNFLHH